MSQSRGNSVMCISWVKSTKEQVHRDQPDIDYPLCIKEETYKIKSFKPDLIDPAATTQKYQKYTVMDQLL